MLRSVGNEETAPSIASLIDDIISTVQPHRKSGIGWCFEGDRYGLL